MKSTIRMTSKGQFTLPIELRRKLGVSEKGDTLSVTYDEQAQAVLLGRPASFEDIQQLTKRHHRPGAKPLLDVHAWYETERTRDLTESASD